MPFHLTYVCPDCGERHMTKPLTPEDASHTHTLVHVNQSQIVHSNPGYHCGFLQ